jgi:hypothetical protein
MNEINQARELAMSITAVNWCWGTGWGNGYATHEIDMVPAQMIISVALVGQSGGGTNFTGIPSYDRRLSNGADQNIGFGDWPSWPPLIYDYISSVVFGIATGSDQQAWALMRIETWG